MNRQDEVEEEEEDKDQFAQYEVPANVIKPA